MPQKKVNPRKPAAKSSGTAKGAATRVTKAARLKTARLKTARLKSSRVKSARVKSAKLKRGRAM